VQLREAKGWDRSDLARTLEIQWGTLKALEDGKSAPRLKMMLALVEALDLPSIDELIGGTMFVRHLEDKR